MKRQIALIFILISSLVIIWLLITENNLVWPIRNTLQYSLMKAWWGDDGYPISEGSGTWRGTVKNQGGVPIVGARILVTRWDGTAWSTRTQADGSFTLNEIDVGTYRPVVGAPGYESVQLGEWRAGLQIEAGQELEDEIVLLSATPQVVSPGKELEIGEANQLSCTSPQASSATRHEVTFLTDEQPNQPTFLYTPITATEESLLPTLLAIYPGPVDTWECVSIPLAAAGYAVLGVGPAYSLDLERDIDEIQQLLGFARQGDLPSVDGSQIIPLGGSYSAILVQRLLQRDHDFKAAVLLGPPTDLFEIRSVFEEGTFLPPFDLDKVLVALGLPNRVPLRYWTYSGAYHTHSNMPPTILFHSRSDEVVPYQQSQRLADAFLEDGVEHELHFFDGGNHYLLSGDEDALEIYDRTLDFLVQYIE